MLLRKKRDNLPLTPSNRIPPKSEVNYITHAIYQITTVLEWNARFETSEFKNYSAGVPLDPLNIPYHQKKK